MSSPRTPRAAIAAVLAASVLVAGCGGVEGMIVSSVVSAAMRTAVDQAVDHAQRTRPTPEQMWHEVQVANLERRALAGELEAQFELGTYYLMLQEPAAQAWICHAANRGHARAQLQYGHWFNEDRAREDLFPFITIVPDNGTAFLWYSLAADNGEPRAPHFRDSLIFAGMPAEALERARLRLTAWTPQRCDSTQVLTAAAPQPGAQAGLLAAR